MAKNPVDKFWDKKQAERSVDPSRLKSIAELVERNRFVHERAKNLVDLGDNGELSPPIVLKGPSGEGDDQVVAIGFVSISTFAWELTTMQTLSVDVYSIKQDELGGIRERFEDVGELLDDIGVHPGQALVQLMGRNPDGSIHEPGLGVSTEGSQSDEINLAARRIASNNFMFSRAINLKRNKKQISKMVDNMDKTIGLFEEAVNDPELNTDHASWADGWSKFVSELPETSE